MKRIDEQISWYQQHATRKDDDIIRIELKAINDIYEEIRYSEDVFFMDKIIEKFCDIIGLQREVIDEMVAEAEQMGMQPPAQPNPFSYSNNLHGFAAQPADVLSRDAEEDSDTGSSEPFAPEEGFINEQQIRGAFERFMKSEGKSSFTINDYYSRLKNLWKSFYKAFQEGGLPEELAVDEGVISEESPLMNVYHHFEELHCYISMMSAHSDKKRNWDNARAALNKFGELMFSEDYKKIKAKSAVKQQKDFSKYLFNGEPYGKSRLVLAVVRQYVAENNPASFSELQRAFPDELQGSKGVVRLLNDVSDKDKGIGGIKRYFLGERERIHLNSGEVAVVCTQWGVTNIENFVTHAKGGLGYSIEKVQER